MTNRSICFLGLLGIASTWIFLDRVSAQTLNQAYPNIYENEQVKVAIQNCDRQMQELTCRAVLTSKNSDRPIDLNGNNIKLIDIEGNEYYASSLKLANRTSENNSIKTELVQDIPFKASFIFGKIPVEMTKIALLQIPLGAEMGATAKFRNLFVNRTIPADIPTDIPVENTIDPPIKNSIARTPDQDQVCPDRTQVLYQGTSKHYRVYICGNKIPTHYVAHSSDGSEGITLRLRYFDRTRFSADNGDTNYTIAANKLIITKDSKVVYQEKIEVVQVLTRKVETETLKPTVKRKKPLTETVTELKPKVKRKKTTTETVENIQPKVKRKKITTETVENIQPKVKPKKVTQTQKPKRKTTTQSSTIDRQKVTTSTMDK